MTITSEQGVPTLDVSAPVRSETAEAIHSYLGLANAFVRLADTLVDDYDVAVMARRLADSLLTSLPVDAVGNLFGDPPGDLQLLAADRSQDHMSGVFAVDSTAGPWLHAFRTGQAVLVDDLTVDRHRWPVFAQRALEHGFRTVCTLPLRLREERVGAVNLFCTRPGGLSASDIALAQALADAATIGMLHHRALAHADRLCQQLQTALNTRVVIEQAKGILAARGGIDMDGAFGRLRATARSTNQRVHDLARAVVDGADTTRILSTALN
jgi:GAF domain-containing protein